MSRKFPTEDKTHKPDYLMRRNLATKTKHTPEDLMRRHLPTEDNAHTRLSNEVNHTHWGQSAHTRHALYFKKNYMNVKEYESKTTGEEHATRIKLRKCAIWPRYVHFYYAWNSTHFVLTHLSIAKPVFKILTGGFILVSDILTTATCADLNLNTL